MNKFLQKRRTFWAMAALAFFILASPLYAKKKEKEAEAAPAPAAADLAMPSGWSDSMLASLGQNQDPRRKLWILEFTGAEKFEKLQELGLNGQALTEIESNSFNKTGKFEIVERKGQEKLEEEIAFQLTDKVGSQVAEPGKFAGADAVVFSTITGANDEETSKVSYKIIRTQVQVVIRCVDASTGKLFYSEQSVGVVDNKLIYDSRGIQVAGNFNPRSAYTKACNQAIDDAVNKIASKFPLIGHVADVSGDQVIINVGSSRGVQVGSRFLVFRKGKTILDPATGKPLTSMKQIICLIQIESSEDNSSTGRIIALKDPQVQPQAGDLVILK